MPYCLGNRILQGHSDPVGAIAIASGDVYIVSASWDRTIKILSIYGEGPVKVLSGHIEDVSCVAVSGDMKYIASGSYDKTVRVWGVEGKGEEAVYKGHSSPVTFVEIVGDNRIIVSRSSDNALRVWDFYNKAELISLENIRSVVVSRNEKYVVAGDVSNVVRVWRIEGSAVGAGSSNFD